MERKKRKRFTWAAVILLTFISWRKTGLMAVLPEFNLKSKSNI